MSITLTNYVRRAGTLPPPAATYVSHNEAAFRQSVEQMVLLLNAHLGAMFAGVARGTDNIVTFPADVALTLGIGARTLVLGSADSGGTGFRAVLVAN